jgi:predicted GIY-YIG superfamily endonuclease
MTLYFIYKIFDPSGKILYIGCSTNPKKRFKQHINMKPGSNHGHGKFYEKNDLQYKILKRYNSKKEALQAEGVYKTLLGFEWTEKTAGEKVGRLRYKYTKEINEGQKKRRKLSDDQIEDIKELYKNGYTQNYISQIYSIGQPLVSRIVNKKRLTN